LGSVEFSLTIGQTAKLSMVSLISFQLSKLSLIGNITENHRTVDLTQHFDNPVNFRCISSLQFIIYFSDSPNLLFFLREGYLFTVWVTMQSCILKSLLIDSINLWSWYLPWLCWAIPISFHSLVPFQWSSLSNLSCIYQNIMPPKSSISLVKFSAPNESLYSTKLLINKVWHFFLKKINFFKYYSLLTIISWIEPSVSSWTVSLLAADWTISRIRSASSWKYTPSNLVTSFR
jgi:hypothetical protein